MSEKKKPDGTPSNSQKSSKEPNEEKIEDVEVIPSDKETSADFKSMDDDLTFMDKIKQFYFVQVYNLHTLLSKMSQNLTWKKKQFTINQQLLEKQPLVHTLDRDAEIQQKLEEIEEDISLKSEQIQNWLKTSQNLYKNIEFQQALSG